MDDVANEAIHSVVAGGPLVGAIDPFFARIRDAADAIGYPCFLRTGQTSNKHRWKKTCHLACREAVEQHVFELVEFSEMADFIGLDTRVWAIRELLPTEPVCVLPAYGDFPLVPEVRCFIQGGSIICAHPYWPEKAIRMGFPGEATLADGEFNVVPANFDEIVAKCHDVGDGWFVWASHVAEAFKDDDSFDDGFSVDLLPTKRGWFVTDMALASRSFHWEGCIYEKLFQPRKKL